MRRFLVCVSLAALVVAGCDKSGGDAPASVSAEALKSAVSDPASRRFYDKDGWAAAWSDSQARALRAALEDSSRHAIDSSSFLAGLDGGGDPARREAALTKAALAYAHALAYGLLDPSKIFDVYTVPKPDFDLEAGLAQALRDGKLREWLDGLAPSDPEYRALSEAYLRYKARAPKDRSAPIPGGEAIEPGDEDGRVPAIRQALQASGYLSSGQAPSAQTSASPKAYSDDLAQAVRKLQSDYGIKPDGVIGDSTLEALNNGADERARILAVNLERRRWLNRQPPQTRIDVNTAAAMLHYWRDGSLVHSARVIVGQPGWETPELGAPIANLVANPDWTVPKSIAEKEIRPKGQAYMERQNIVEKNGRLVQQPGPDNALGQVKFDMIDDQAIYLHDTPSKSLFSRDERHLSHGCVRVQDAVAFARRIASDQGVRDAFEKAFGKKDEIPVELPHKIPVRLMYHTAYLDGGAIVFRPDPYGWDDKVATALGLGGAIRHHKVETVDDVGP